MKKIFNYTLLVLLIGLFATSCTKNWEENNIDPNNPVDVPMTNLLANSIINTGTDFFDEWQGMNNFLSYSGQVTKIFYIDEARYQFRPNIVDNVWRDYYRVQIDLSKIKEKAIASENPVMQAVAETYSVFLWQMAVDQWGNIPYSEAIAAESDENWTPKYDKAEDIYADLFVRLEEANKLFNSTTGIPASQIKIGNGDFIYGQDAGKWQKWCNSLRLRLAIRISNVNPGEAKKQFEAVLRDPAGHPIFASRDDEAKLKWESTAPYKEPWALNHESRDDHAMAETFINRLSDLGDPRLPVFALPIEDGRYIGAPEGAPNNAFNPDTISRIGTLYRDIPDGYTYFMRYAEVQFIIAESALLGGVDAIAQAAYMEGIKASFEETGVADTCYTKYTEKDAVAWSGSIGEKLMKIHEQKWIAMFKEGQELWAEQRRTDYPEMPSASGSVYGPENHNRGPFRYPYPVSEQNLNSANITPEMAGIVDDFWGKQLFWDTRTGVH
jgi:hypothetical protein